MKFVILYTIAYNDLDKNRTEKEIVNEYTKTYDLTNDFIPTQIRNEHTDPTSLISHIIFKVGKIMGSRDGLVYRMLR